MDITFSGINFDISTIISIVSLCGTAFVFAFFQCKMNRQQIKINKDTIEQNAKEREDKLKAEICAYRERESQAIVFMNKGKGIATNIRIQFNNLSQENGFLVIPDKKKNPYPLLNNGDIFKLHLQQCSQIKETPIITLIWDDDFAKNREKRQAIDL